MLTLGDYEQAILVVRRIDSYLANQKTDAPMVVALLRSAVAVLRQMIGVEHGR